MPTRVALSEWERLTEELTRFGGAADVTVDDDRVRVDFGRAHVTVTRDGHVSTGMPLHDFERSDARALLFDHEAGSLTVEGEASTYTFRRPGGQ